MVVLFQHLLFNPDVTSVLRLDASVSFLVYNEYIFVGAGADRLVPNDIAFTDAETEKNKNRLCCR